MKILDMCCGGRMFWFDKENPHATFLDIRDFECRACDGRTIRVKPDIVADFRNIPFPDEYFDHVVFDPPHLLKVGENAWLAQKYGKLSKETWKEDLKKGFEEGMRVLKNHGTLVFKWNEQDVKLQEIIRIFGSSPLYGNRTSKNTIWMVFAK